MPATRYYLDRLVIDVGDPAADATVRGLGGLELSHEFTATDDAGGSALDPATRAVTQVAGTARGRTLSVDALLTSMWASGRLIPVVPIVGGTGATLYYASAVEGGLRGGAGTHQAARVTHGQIVPLRISGSGQGLAQLEFMVQAFWDGTNVPIQRLAAQSLPSGSAAAPTLWRLAAIEFGTTVIHKVRPDWSLDFGVQQAVIGAANSPYQVDGAVVGCAPTMEFATAACKDLLDLGFLGGAAVPAGGLKVYLAAYAPTAAGFLTTGALKLTFREGSLLIVRAVRAGGREPRYVECQVIGRGGDTIASGQEPLSYATGQTIPAETATPGLWRSGPIKDATTPLEYEDAVLQPGLEVETESISAHLHWPHALHVRRRSPTLEATLIDLDTARALEASLGGETTDDAFFMYLRKLGDASEPLADAVAQHIKFTIHKARKEIVAVPAESGRIVRPRLRVTARELGGNLLSLATASAIT